MDFNSYILKAVDYLMKNYACLGYGNYAYTHDLPLGPKLAPIKGSENRKTMCVASQQEVILTAMDLYYKDTNNATIYDFLPRRSWLGFTEFDIHAHIWVTSYSAGTPDALAHFGMGEIKKFEELQPGDFIGCNRVDGLGHAVTFLNYIDKYGNIQATHNNQVAGFKFFSSQGRSYRSNSGQDIRYVLFHLPQPRDTETHLWYPSLIYSTNQKILNCGRMWHPLKWDKSIRPRGSKIVAMLKPRLKFDHSKFDQLA